MIHLVFFIFANLCSLSWSAETDWLQAPKQRKGFNSAAAINELGLDEEGWFHRTGKQRVGPEIILALASNREYAEGVLQRGQVTSVHSLEEQYNMFRAEMRLAPQDATTLGVESLRVAFKPAARDWYGREYRRELVFYKLAKHLEIHGVLPMVERDVDHRPLAKQLANLNEKQKKALFIYDSGEGKTLHGTVQLWMTGLTMRIGTERSEHNKLRAIAKSLHFGGAVDITKDPIWQALSDMFVLDYLVYNSDRALEVGTVGLPDGGQRLVLLDHGDSLRIRSKDDDPYRHYDRRFSEIGVFSPNLLNGLHTLTEEVLENLWVDNKGVGLCDDIHFERVANRAKAAIQHIRTLGEKAGGLDKVLFSQNSRPMH